MMLLEESGVIFFLLISCGIRYDGTLHVIELLPSSLQTHSSEDVDGGSGSK